MPIGAIRPMTDTETFTPRTELLVSRLARKFKPRHGGCLSLEDLEQAGRVGLIEAASKCRPGEPLHVFAYAIVRRHIIEAVRDSHAIRFPRSQFAQACAVNNRRSG